MNELFEKKKKKSMVVLQLAPLIDIFVLIIIFLIKGTVMSGASITPPKDLHPAKSKSPEGVEPAAQVFVTQHEVVFAMINEKISLSEFLNEIQNNTLDKLSGHSLAITQKLKEFLVKMPDLDKKSGVLMNFLADSAVDYKTTFEISKYCREIGFQNILFVAEGEKQ